MIILVQQLRHFTKIILFEPYERKEGKKIINIIIKLCSSVFFFAKNECLLIAVLLIYHLRILNFIELLSTVKLGYNELGYNKLPVIVNKFESMVGFQCFLNHLSRL